MCKDHQKLTGVAAGFSPRRVVYNQLLMKDFLPDILIMLAVYGVLCSWLSWADIGGSAGVGLIFLTSVILTVVGPDTRKHVPVIRRDLLRSGDHLHWFDPSANQDEVVFFWRIPSPEELAIHGADPQGIYVVVLRSNHSEFCLHINNLVAIV